MDCAPVVSLRALLLSEFKTGFVIKVQRHHDFPGLTVGLRIFYGGFVSDRVGSAARVAFYNVQSVAMRVPGRIQPGLVVEISNIHHQRVSFPMANRSAHAEIDPVKMWA